MSETSTDDTEQFDGFLDVRCWDCGRDLANSDPKANLYLEDAGGRRTLCNSCYRLRKNGSKQTRLTGVSSKFETETGRVEGGDGR